METDLRLPTRLQSGATNAVSKLMRGETGRTHFTQAVAGDSEVRHARHEHRRQSAGEACLPFHGNPLPLNAMRFYSAMWR